MENAKSNSDSPRNQSASTRPIIDHPELPHMPKDAPRDLTRETSKKRTMPSENEVKARKVSEKGRFMEAVEPKEAARMKATAKPTESMKPHEQEDVSNRRHTYLRLRIRVTDDRMRIVDAQQVDGPLVLSNSLVGDHAYEAILDGKTIAVEGLPDLGISRSYPRPGEMEHHITPRSTFEFNVRIPGESVTANALGRLHLGLYRLPDASHRTVTTSLTRELGQQAQLVASFEGITRDHLEKRALEQLQRIFPASFREK